MLNVLKDHNGFVIKLQFFFVIIGFFFGMVGIKASTTLVKQICYIYQTWRVFITFTYPFLEIANGFYIYSAIMKEIFGIYNPNISFFLLILTFLFNLYLTYITWSFYIRLKQSHELIIIHGDKYLKHLMELDKNGVICSTYDMNLPYIPPNIHIDINDTQSSYQSRKNSNSIDILRRDSLEDIKLKNKVKCSKWVKFVTKSSYKFV